MAEIKRILHISPDFNYSCGVSKYVFTILKNFSQNSSYKVFFITNGGDALDKLKKIGIAPSILKFSRGQKNVLNILPNLKILKKYCVENNIDIIHTHHRYPEYLAYKISRKLNLNTITTVHSLVDGKNRFSFKSDRLIAVSKTVEKMLKGKYHVPSNKVLMMYNCVEQLDIDFNNMKKENLKNKFDIPTDAKVILYLGRISSLKGVDLLIDAYKIINNEFSNIFLLIVGQIYDRSLKKDLDNLPHQIKLINPVENPYSVYSIADIIVLPSRMDSFPYIMLESGLFKKPFIGSKTGGIAEFIEDGVDGLLFEPGSLEQLADKIKYLLERPEKAKIFGENLCLKVKENISCEQYYKRLNQVYNEFDRFNFHSIETSKKKIFDLWIDDIDYNSIYYKILNSIKSKKKLVINYANANTVRLTKRNLDLKKALLQADIIHSDGVGIWAASRILKVSTLNYRFNFTDCSIKFLKDCQQNRWSIFLFGATEKVLKIALRKIELKYPGLNVVGALNGYCKLSDNDIVEIINNSKPDILWVGLGTPKQEIWINKNKDLLNCCLIQSVGDLMTFVAEKKIRGPIFIQKLGLEWSIRFLRSPVKYFNRYIIGIPIFSFLLLKQKLKEYSI